MIGTVTVNGMVLSAMPMGEYDKRLTILTVERGKISAFARGARRPNSSLLACSQPFSYGEFTMYAGRDSYTVSAAQIENYFPGLRQEPERAFLGMYFCEFADYFTREGNDEREVLRLLYQSLRALESGKFSPALVRRIFELKLIAVEGEAPQVFECVRCRRGKGSAGSRGSAACRLPQRPDARGKGTGPAGEQGPDARDKGTGPAGEQGPDARDKGTGPAGEQGPDARDKGTGPEEEQRPVNGWEEEKQPEEETLTHFLMRRDGMICSKCAAELGAGSDGEEGNADCRPVSAACLYAMQYVIGTPSAQLFRFTLKDGVLEEFAAIVGQYIKKHVDREMKALQVLESMPQ